MYKAMDVAQYVINYAIELGKPVSNLKLQKLLYYIQAKFLVENKDGCFEEDIENWRHGPVVTNVYDNFKKYGNQDIEEIQTGYRAFEIDEEFNFSFKKKKFNEANIELKDRELINKVVNVLIDKDAWELVRMTHEEAPWRNTKRGDIITTESIYNYFLLNSKVNL